ncbi:MAG: methyltransferase domain-containing protein [Ilumatobacter sp.]|uniref:class I SAM-dependent methyltransferase n=1 Tax=Ilumatobacter sp. TaxID=1967498 RepID=UPI003C74FB2B
MPTGASSMTGENDGGAGDEAGTPFAAWRSEIISEFRLRGAERCAAASPFPGFPQILESIIEALDVAPVGPWLDVGGGLGGTASWIERTTRRQVHLVDPVVEDLSSARDLFPGLSVSCGDVDRLPVRSGTVSAVVLDGVVSERADVVPLLREVKRVLAARGRLAVTDLWSSGASGGGVGPRYFRSLEDFVAVAERGGLALTHVAVADVSVGWWSQAAEQVHDEIAVRHRSSPAYERWCAQLERLQRVLDSGEVLAAGLVLGAAEPLGPS